MKRLSVALVPLVVALMSVHAEAQARTANGEMIYAFRNAAFVDIPISHPCVGQVVSSTMTLYDGNPWIVFTCSENQVILRRFLNPNDHVKEPAAVYLVPPPLDTTSTVPAAPTTSPTPGPLPDACTPIGMVTGVYGGCVPKSHPYAPKAAAQ